MVEKVTEIKATLHKTESINRADNRAAQREVQAKQRQAEIAEEQRKKNLGTGPLKK